MPLAVRQALDEAGPGTTFQAAFCGTAYGGVAAGHRVLGELGLTGGPIIDIEAGCASGAAALSMAAGAIRAGQYDTVLVFGIEKMPKGIIRSSFFDPWREQAGLAATPAYFALRAQRLMIDSGITKEQLAAVVVKNRAPGRAQRERDVPQGGHRRRRAGLEGGVRAAAPVHAVLTQRGRGRGRAARRRPAACSCGPRRCAATCPATCSTRARRCAGWSTATRRRRRALAAADAYAAAGLGPDDIDVAECQDTDAARELLAYVELGLCAPGDVGGCSTRARRPWAVASR